MTKTKGMKKSITIALLLITTLTATAQRGRVTLKVGDEAPQLKVTWLKGEAIDHFKDDQLYLVEFWATWCGPCKSAMPHLSQLQKNYSELLTVVGVNIWERNYQERRYSTFTKRVTDFIEEMGDKMEYRVAMDQDDLYMAQKWMRAAGRTGIPASFLIEKGRVVWIGHPNLAEEVIKEVVKGSYNVEAVAKEMEEQRQAGEKRESNYRALLKEIDQTLERGEWERAIELADGAMEGLRGNNLNNLYRLKLRGQLELNPEQVPSLLREWEAMVPHASIFAATIIKEREGLPNHLYQYAIDAFRGRIEEGVATPALLLEQIGHLYLLKGEKRQATNTLKLAIKEGEKAIKSGDPNNRVTPERVKKMKDLLKESKKR